MVHSHIDIARSPQQTAQLSVIAYRNNSKHFFIFVTKKIMFRNQQVANRQQRPFNKILK